MQDQGILPGTMLNKGECNETDCQVYEVLSQFINVSKQKTSPSYQTTKPSHYGYTLTTDNIDMNIRRTFQRLDSTTQLLHFCHVFAALNQWTLQC